MRPELEHIEKIERYLLGTLKGEELQQFLHKLDNNPELKEEVELQRLIMESVEIAGVRRDLNDIYDQCYSWRGFIRRNWWKFGIGIFFIGSLFFFYSVSIKSIEEEKYYLDDLKEITENDSVPEKNEVEITDGRTEENLFLAEKNIVSKPALFLKGFIENFPAQIFQISHNKDTLIYSSGGSKIMIPSGAFTDEAGNDVNGILSFSVKEITRKSDILINDLAEEGYETFGGMYLESYQENNKLYLSKEKKLKIQFADEPPVHVNIPDLAPVSKSKDEKTEKFYFKIFDDHSERRIIVLPAVVLDYDIIYTGKSLNPVMNERVESLLLPEFENTFTSTTQFHYRIEGCQLYGEGVELLDIYLSNRHLKLWQADSLVESYLQKKAEENCEQFERYMKAAEYFRWLKSMRHGKPVRMHQLDYRNYRKGQLYNKLPDKVLERYLHDAGLSDYESDELIGYFKKMFYYKKMFQKQMQLAEGNLDYYYVSEGRFVGFEKNCSQDKHRKYLVEAGGNIISAKEINSFIPLRNLGWVSNERFINYKNTTDLNVKLKSKDSTLFAKVYLVFKNYDMVMGGKWTESGENYFGKLPSETDIFVVAIGYLGNKIYKGLAEVRTGRESEVQLMMEEVSEERLIKDLKMLDK